MESLVKRIGYFLRETTESRGVSQENRYIVRYFILDNDYNLHYTVAYSTLQDVIKKSQKYSDLYERIENKFKSIKLSDIEVSKIKDYERPEFMPFLNQKYVEVTLSIQDVNLETSTVGDRSSGTRRSDGDGSGGRKTEYNLLFFTFKDQHIDLMREFLVNYHEEAKKDKITDLSTYVLIGNRSGNSNTSGGEIEKQRINEKVAAVKKNYEKMNEIFKMVKEEEKEGEVDIISEDNTEKEMEEVNKEEDENIDNNNNENEVNDNDNDNKQDKEDEEPEENKEEGEIEENIEEKPTTEKIGNYVEQEEKAKEKENHNEALKRQDSVLKLKTGVTYSGPTKEGKAHGSGKEFFKSGVSYVGTFKEGKRHGYGYFINSDRYMCYIESMDGDIVGI